MDSVPSVRGELFVPNLAAADWLILLIYGFFMLTAGFSLKPTMTGSREFMQAGRAMPGWLCGLAMLGAGLGSQELLGMGAAGARYGLTSMGLFALGSIPAMLFLGLYLMPVFYGPKSGLPAGGIAARSIPEYVGQRFGQKTRALSACMFLSAATFSAGMALYVMARIFLTLHVFDRIADPLHLSSNGILLLAMALPAALVLTYILLGGLGAAMYNQALQFCLAIAGLLPAVLLGLKKIGGWDGLKVAVPAVFSPAWGGAAHAGPHAIGVGTVITVVGVGLVLGGGTWCTDFRLLQMPMAAKSLDSARRAPLTAAAVCVLAPLVLILPGTIAVGLPTPRTTILIYNENGAIVHDITVVPPNVEAGHGLVPAKAGADGKPVMAADGHAVLDYAMATPNMLVQFLPMGLLGLGITAFAACLMGGVAASVTAVSTVFSVDIFQAFISKGASDRHLLAVSRWAAVGGILLALGAACSAMRFSSMPGAMMLVFAVVNAPLFAVLLLGTFWKRATGPGAFAGLTAGAAGALLLHGLALPSGEQRGIHGGWIAILYHPESEMVLGLEMALIAFAASLLIAVVVSVSTKARPEEELNGLVRSLTARPPASAKWWKRPEALAAAILLAAIAVNAILL